VYDKLVDISFDARTFPKKKLPRNFRAGQTTIDMLAALHMLGTLTVPGGFSVASAAAHWAWIRYLSALSTRPPLAITRPFGDLDPHQKTVLSDDFGVAVTSQWLLTAVGGFKQVVDGRKFILNYARLVAHSVPSPKKVGPRKSPDFVILDNAGKWHVMECKGTQTSVAHSHRQLAQARRQKGAIAIDRALAGFRLAAGLYVCPDGANTRSRITVHDPEATSPIVQVANNEAAQQAACRITAARSLGLAGFTQLANEVDFVETKDARLRVLFSEQELARAAVPADERIAGAHKDLQISRSTFAVKNREYAGRQISTSIPWPANGYEFRRVTVQQGVEVGFLQSIRASPVNSLLENVDVLSAEAIGNDSIVSTSGETGATILQGNLFVSSLLFD
jgi:hypothetical protein